MGKVGMYSKLLLCVIASLIVVSYSVDDIFVEASDDRPDAYLEWLEESYPSTGTGVVRVIDPDMNLDPKAVDNFDVDVWSDSDFAGIDLTVSETNEATGIFEGTVFFTTTDDSSGHRLRVMKGDTIYSKYEDNTLSESYATTDRLDVIGTAFIQGAPDSIIDDRISLDKKSYTWTDKVYITIVSPNHNFDSDLVEEIGNTDEYPVEIATRQFSLDNYKLVETGTDTGIFTGEIILTGFTHDADGNPRTGVDGNDVVDINPSGKGPTDGFLPSSSDDGVTIAFEFSEDETVVGSAPIHWNEGQMEWLEADYPATGTAVVRVIDPDMNWNPEAVDNFDVYVWSDSDLKGTDPTVSETGKATGIFEGIVFFTTTDESSGHRLRVMVGDTLYSKYEDNTLPSPYALADELDITDTSMIRIDMSPLKQTQFGIAPSDVQCKSGMELILKHSGEPVCVKPETKQKLIERGW